MGSILTLDLGTKCGWSVKTPDSLHYGCFVSKDKKEQNLGQRFHNFEQFLEKIIEKYELAKDPIEQICYEDVKNHKGVYAAHIYGGFQSILMKIAYEHNIPLFGYPVTTIKKHVACSGTASKAEMIKAINTVYKLDVTDDNTADALGVLYTHDVCYYQK